MLIKSCSQIIGDADVERSVRATGEKHLTAVMADTYYGYALYITPADASVIYDTPNQNFNPAAKQTLDGTGVTIGVIGYSALAMADVANYRKAFLPASAAGNLPKQILDGGIDPGVLNGSVASEGLLDVEIAGGLAGRGN